VNEVRLTLYEISRLLRVRRNWLFVAALVIAPLLLCTDMFGLGNSYFGTMTNVFVLVFFMTFTTFALPSFLDVMGSSLMRIPTAAIPVQGTIPFVVPLDFSLSRLMVSGVGILLIAAGSPRYGSREGMRKILPLT
jgi:hypothetical protein